MQRAHHAMTAAEAMALGMRAYGFTSTDPELAASGNAAETAVLVDAIDRLIRDEALLSRFGERTGFAPEAAYEARRRLIRP